MKKAPLFASAITAILVLTPAADAASITGSVNFSSAAGGGITLQDSSGNTTTDLAIATGIQSWMLSEVEVGSGSFSTVPNGSAVTLNGPWIFNPSTSTSPLWTIAGPENFSFSLTSSTIIFQSGSFLAIEGTGILTGTNFDPTAGTWAFTTQGNAADNKFSWSSTSEGAPVADSGTSLGLLAGSLLGLCGLLRKSRGR